eukprot:1157858-Pelagomonas_calceolata.AAC.3
MVHATEASSRLTLPAGLRPLAFFPSVASEFQAHMLLGIPQMIASPLDVPKWKLKDELEFAYDFQKSFGEEDRPPAMV